MMHLVLLAAGSARRFGANKLMHPIDAKPMFMHTLERLVSISKARGWDVTMVTQEGPVLSAAQGMACRIAVNPHHAQGISTSIRCALAALPGDGAPAVFFVADQPWLTQQTIVEFIDGWLASGRSCGCVAHGGETGNPAAFSAELFPELMALEGDRGGKMVIKKHKEDCHIHQVSDPKELQDIDLPI